MQTILNIKTEKELKQEAQGLASEFGMPLTTVINSFLRQFVRERRIVLEAEPRIKDNLMDKWHSISTQANKKISTNKKFDNASALIKYLKI